MKKLTTDADMIRVLEENITILQRDLVRKVFYRLRGGLSFNCTISEMKLFMCVFFSVSTQ